MKKLLLSSAAIGALALVPAAANAQVSLDLGGYVKGYGVYVDQDENADTDGGTVGVQSAGESNDFDIIRDTEVHFTGETTLDNGLTVGVHVETAADGADGFGVDESYLYFSGDWGRFNGGAEDGAGYLLQVAAPSADSNIDGIRQYVQPVNYAVALGDSNASGASTDELFLGAGGVGGGAVVMGTTGVPIAIDYAMDPTGKADKVTYLSPVFNGFQLGATFTPDSNTFAGSLQGIGFDDVPNTFGRAYEAALRYEGQFNNVGVILGAGFAHVENEQKGVIAAGAIPAGATAAVRGGPSDDRQVWNVGADFDIGPFGLGASYQEDDMGERVMTAQTVGAAAVIGDDEETLVVGADYTTGPFQLGVSYFTQDNTFGIKNLDTDRYSGGVVYTYGPGMTFRGSIGYIEHEATNIGGPGKGDIDATYVAIGTQVNF